MSKRNLEALKAKHGALLNGIMEGVGVEPELGEAFFTVKGVEIFHAGKWTDDAGRVTEYTHKDLEIIAALLNDESGDFPVILAETNAVVGWLCNARTEGGRLLADIRDMPESAFRVMEAGGYKNRSLEIERNRNEDSGEIYTHSAVLMLLNNSVEPETELPITTPAPPPAPVRVEIEQNRTVPPTHPACACNCPMGSAAALGLDGLIADVLAEHVRGDVFRGPADKNAVAAKLLDFAALIDRCVSREVGWLKAGIAAALIEPARRAAKLLESTDATPADMLEALGRG